MAARRAAALLASRALTEAAAASEASRALLQPVAAAAALRSADPGGQGGAGKAGAAAWGGAALAAVAATAASLPVALAEVKQAPAARTFNPAEAPGAPLSGNPAALDERGRTNNPLDYDPITNEHTAAMTLARKLGMEAYEAGRYADAEAKFKEALSEARQGFPPNDLHIPSVLNLLAEFYRNTGRRDEAAALYQEALDCLEDATGEKHWMFASALVNLALLKEEAGDLPAAAALLERALSLRRAMFGPNSMPYADAAFGLGRVLRDIAKRGGAGSGEEGSGGGGGGGARGWFGGRRGGGDAKGNEARWLALMGDAIRVLNESGDTSGSPIIGWEMAYAEALRDAARPSEAAEQLTLALAHLAAAEGPAAADASEIAERRVDALEAAGREAEAREAMRACVEARMQLFGRHLVVAKSMTRLARMLLQPAAAAGGKAARGGGNAAAASAADAELARGFAGGAVELAEEAVAAAEAGRSLRGTDSGGGLRGLLGGLFGKRGGGGSGNGSASAAGALADKLRAQLELGLALQALAAANAACTTAAGRQSGAAPAEAAGSPGQSVLAPLRRAVDTLRRASRDGEVRLGQLGAETDASDAEQAAALDRAAGLLVDVRLSHIDSLEALAAAISKGRGSGRDSVVAEAEARSLLQEANLIATELAG